MSAIDRLGLIEFKNQTKKQKTLFEEELGDSNKIVKMKDKINYILLWLCEIEEKLEGIDK